MHHLTSKRFRDIKTEKEGRLRKEIISSTFQWTFVMFSPLCIAMFFGGKYFKDKNNKIGCNLIFISVVLFIFAIIQALLGAYGAKIRHLLSCLRQQKTHFCLPTKVRFLNDVCLRQMMTASPNDVRCANDVCLTAHWANIASLRPTGTTSYLRSKCIISP